MFLQLLVLAFSLLKNPMVISATGVSAATAILRAVPVRRQAADPVDNRDHRNVRRRITIDPGNINQRQKQQIRIATFNIRSGRGERLVSATRAMQQLNVDVALLTEAKLTDEMYARHSFGYEIQATRAMHHSQSGVALCWRDTDVSQVEGVCQHGPNVISCELVSGARRWLVIGAYIPPNEDDGRTLEHVSAAQGRRPRLPVILLGDLNVDFSSIPEGARRGTGIATAVASLGVEDMARHFQQSRRHRGGYTWKMTRQNEKIYGRCDYIMADDRRYFSSVRIVSPRLYDSDHFAVVGVLSARPQREHRQYITGRKKFPLKVARGERNDADRLLKGIHSGAGDRPPVREREQSWISYETWRLVDQRAQGRREGTLSGREFRIISSPIRRSLQRDRKRRIIAAGVAIQAALDGNDLKGAWDLMKRWYRHASGRSQKPSRLDMQELERVYSTLYRAEEPPGEPLPVHYVPTSPIPDDVPLENEIWKAVRNLKSGRAPGPSGLKIEEVKEWASNKREDPEP